MTEHLDDLETRPPAQREQQWMAALPQLLARAQTQAAGWAEQLASIDPAAITSREQLAKLPVLRKHDVLDRQRQTPREAGPFAGLATVGWRGVPHAHVTRRVFQSPGPLYEPEGPGADPWRMARALFAAGFRAGDLAHNSFSYHLTPAGAMMESGAWALGCAVFPAGVGNTELQLQAIRDLRPHGYLGTPSFLKILLDKAADSPLPSLGLTKALVSGEAFPASLRDWLAERDIAAFQCYATADLGLIAYETSAREGLVVDEGVLLEIVRPGTADPVPDGEVGEVVVTTACPGYPLIRFGTGDLSAILPGPCPTGRSNVRIRGWLGRADQTAKVRGMFVHPSQVADVVKHHPEIQRARLIIEGEMAQDRMSLHCETRQPQDDFAARVATTLRDLTKLRGDVLAVPVGSLPNDGKVIEDRRHHR